MDNRDTSWSDAYPDNHHPDTSVSQVTGGDSDHMDAFHGAQYGTVPERTVHDPPFTGHNLHTTAL